MLNSLWRLPETIHKQQAFLRGKEEEATEGADLVDGRKMPQMCKDTMARLDIVSVAHHARFVKSSWEEARRTSGTPQLECVACPSNSRLTLEQR